MSYAYIERITVLPKSYMHAPFSGQHDHVCDSLCSFKYYVLKQIL